jgi:uncharacterized protein YjiS (DUF1127 family)
MSSTIVQALARTFSQLAAGHTSQQGDSPSRAVSWIDTARMWVERSRQRRALGGPGELNDALLKDIGVSRDEALREAAKRFWQH